MISFAYQNCVEEMLSLDGVVFQGYQIVIKMVEGKKVAHKPVHMSPPLYLPQRYRD